MTRRNGEPRPLSESERRLWRLVNHETAIYHDDNMQDEEWAEEPVLPAPAEPPRAPEPGATTAPANSRTKAPLPPLRSGFYAGIDRRKAQAVHRGQLRPQRHIDLHGLNQLDARDALRAGIMQAMKRGERLILVITGKGRSQESVLRKALPDWLNEPDIRRKVLAFDRATPKDGGMGAFYVLLKKPERQ